MISIITPTYNREVLVQRTIHSILRQTYSDWELIIVDDGSTDNTESAVKQFLSDPRISYYKKSNSGQPHSLNVGVSKAQGEFIVFLDSDDEAFPEWLSTMAPHLDDETGIASCEAIRKFGEEKTVHERLDVIRFMGKKLHLKFTCGSFFIRRSLFQAVGGYDTDLKANIQTDLGYRLLMHLQKTNYSAIAINEPLVQINVHAGPRIRTDWPKMIVGGEQFLQKHYALFSKYDPDVISLLSGSIAYFYYRLHKRKSAVNYTFKAIRYNPLRWQNYLRVIRYVCL